MGRHRMRRSVARAFWLVAALGLVFVGVACSDADEDGDERDFCALLAQGVGLSETAFADYEQLAAVAPAPIRVTVLRLRNGAVDLDAIDPLDIEALFNARFAPNAVAARTALDEYAVNACNIDLTAGPPVSSDDLTNDINAFLADNFGDAAWLGRIDVTPGTSGGQVTSLIGRFRVAADSEEQAAEVCRALSVYLYTLRSGTGTVSIESGGQVAAFRSGPASDCRPV